jgi:hypothetical protein
MEGQANVRYSPESRHRGTRSGCPLCAKSRRWLAYSITSLARSKIEVGNVKPAALAVFKLTVSSK